VFNHADVVPDSRGEEEVHVRSTMSLDQLVNSFFIEVVLDIISLNPETQTGAWLTL
jgi:hypothetical protein